MRGARTGPGKVMEPDKLISEARARIMWGESPSAIREFLVANGISDPVADARITEFILERNREIRSIGVRDALTGAGLASAAGGALYWISTWVLPPGAARVYGMGGRVIIAGVVVLGAIALYGFWKLVKGIIYLVRPQSEHTSIPDMSE
jgi:hypothetical protein